MPPQEKEGLVEILKRNINVFAWDAFDAPGIDPIFICHHLNINPSITPKSSHPGAHQESMLMQSKTR